MKFIILSFKWILNVKTVTYNGETKTPETAAQNPSELTGISGTAVRFPVTANSDGSFNGVFDFVAVENYSGDIIASVIGRSIIADNSFLDSSAVQKTIAINPVADAPSANSADVVASDGVEDAVIGSGNTAKIAVDADLTDTDGSEQLSIILKLPAEVTGASFVPGNGDAVVTGTVATDVSGFDGQRVVGFNVASGQENSGKFEFELVLENHFSGSSSLEVVARSTDGADIIDTNVGSHSFVIAPVADAPILEGGNVTIETGSEDGFDLSGTADPTRVNLSAQYSDLSEAHKVILILDQNSKGVVYNGATFNATNINVPANITLSGNQKYVLIDVAPSEDGSFAGHFDVLPNDNYSGTLDVSIIARSIESDNSYADSSKIDKTLTINPVADAPSANSADVVASDGVEDAVIGSGNTAKIAVDADLTDTDGSEQLSIILKLPSEVTGASFVPGNGDAVVTGTVATDVSGFDGQRVVSFNVASGQGEFRQI